MRIDWRMPLHRLVGGLLVAMVCATSAAAQHIAYDSTARRLDPDLRLGLLSVASPRPAGRVRLLRSDSADGRSAGHGAAASHDLTGVAADQSLEPTSLRLLSDSTVRCPPAGQSSGSISST